VISKPIVKNSRNQSNITRSKIENNQNYSISGLKSSDKTDDEDMPSKPIPDWATNSNLTRTALAQAKKCLNYTQVFPNTLKENVVMEDVFSIKKEHFKLRTSSAEWDSPPVW
jgi:transposase-like protein